MRWGIHTIEDYHPDRYPLPQFYDRLIARAVLAEELGAEGIWLTEHHFHWYGGAHANPLVALSAIAARTKRLRLGTAVALLPFWHPLKLAEDYACLDNLSNGRLDLGVGRGFFKVEYDGLGYAMAESRARFDECLAVLRRAWTEHRFSHQGDFFRFEDVESVPKPVQSPHPPIWIAASQTPESFANAGRLGQPLMIVPYVSPSLDALKQKVGLYHAAFKEAGHRHAPEVLAIFLAYVDDDLKGLAKRLAEPIKAYGQATIAPIFMAKGEKDSKQYSNSSTPADLMRYFTFDALNQDKALFGTPTHCADVVRRWHEEVGVTYFSIIPSWGTIAEEEVQRTIRRFGTEVAALV
jgi:natural product biosynthesis luciferase-like monooxygenase protein